MSASFLVRADAIVIPRAELPEVTPSDDGTYAQVQTNGGPDGFSTTRVAAGSDHYRRVALAALAKAEYLDAHPPTPPVDEADVETLAGLIAGPLANPAWIARQMDFARRLLTDIGPNGERVSVTR